MKSYNITQLSLDLAASRIAFDLPKMTNKQRFILKNLDPKSALKYISSLMGVKTSVELDLIKPVEKDNDEKPLVRESKNHFLRMLDDRFQVGSCTTPILSKELYYGIEIECLIPFNSMGMYNGDYESDSSEEVECSCCEGSGTLEFTHRGSGLTVEGDCQLCEGSGRAINDSDDDDSQERMISGARKFFNSRVKKLKITGLDVKSDGSIDREGDYDLCPLEITLLVKQNDLSNLEKLCSLLDDLGAVVNSSCGLHVHLDSRHIKNDDKELKRISRKFDSCLDYLFAMVPKSRRSNRYCKKSVSDFNGCRYHAVNMTSVSKHGTIEIRLHSATTNFFKISNWLKIISAIYSKELNHSINNWSSFFKFIEADQDLKEYVMERVEKFGGTLEENELNEREAS